MAEETLDELVEASARKLGELIQRPRLTAKLLQKPPFRYLHDIVTAVMNATGFPLGLFPESLLDSQNIKDKEAKITFLQTLIDVLKTIEPLQAQPVKIVAGLEPEHTNKMLCVLAETAARVQSGELKNDQLVARIRPELGTSTPAKKEETHFEAEKPAVSLVEESKEPEATRELPRQRSIEEGQIPSNSEYWKVTQSTLGAIITKPALTEKLLQRPPFRFLQDVCKSLHSQTALFQDAFTPDELSQKLSAAPDKARFLKKLVQFVQSSAPEPIATHLKSLQVKKILAGAEPEKTNLLLQTLAQLASEPVRPAPSRAAEAPAPAPAPAPVEAAPLQRPPSRAGPPAKQRGNVRPGKVDQNKKVEEEKPLMKAPDRPKTARRAPPKVETNVVKEVDEVTAPARGVILDGDHEDEEDDEDDGIEEDIHEEPIHQGEEDEMPLTTNEDSGKHGKLVRDILEEQSKAQAEAAAEKKGLRSTPSAQGSAGTTTPSKGISLGRIGNKSGGGGAVPSSGGSNYSQQQLAALQERIQKMCQSVNPLGKSLEFVWDDLAHMDKELGHWKQEQGRQRARVERERQRTAQQLNPLQEQLGRVEQEIEQQHRQLRQVKAEIHRNERQLQELLQARAMG